MARYGQRPENALKRATEFIEVGKPARALDTLYEVFKNKKWVFSWSESVLEPIMFKYLELCVELKKSHIAKEGLFQYRNLFQSVNVGSLENVIRFYLRTAEERTEQAREQSQQAVVDIDDLDNLATPESILLSAVSGEDAQDRSDRTILTPWVKFLWESYCQCLELLRTNTHVETLYHDIARMAFHFCLKYSRKTEFRKLCDKLRKHLEDIQKLTPQVANVSITKPETQQLNQDTRLVQLDSAIQMELWQEAYKAIEDIHGLMNLAKKSPVPKTMANYYQKLALVFWKAGNYLFHAAALFKLFQLSKEMKKNITPEELQKMACRVLIATLSIPLPSAHPEFDRFIETDKSPLEKAQRLAVLLGLFQPPTRQSLLRDVVRMNVVGLASPQLQELYQWLEVEFHPLQLCGRVHGIVEQIQTDENCGPLIQYIPALQDVTLIRLIRQVSQVYQTIEFPRLVELAKFTTLFHLERLLVDCVRHNDMQIRIDHRSNCIHFGMDLSQSQREDKTEGPTLQSMPSEQIRNQLINMATVLRHAMTVIEPQKNKVEREKLKAQMVQHYHETKVREHRDVLARRQIIEDRKEYLERLNTVREEEEARRQEEFQRQQVIAEQKRLNQEREERERKRQENELQQIKDRHLKEKMQQISQTTHGQRILKKLEEDDIKKMDADEIAAREVEELQKERRELQQKLKSQEKKVDYFERAKRLEEIPLLQKAFEEKKEQDMKFWEQQEKERIQMLIEERQQAVETRERMQRMKEEKDIFIAKLQNERKSDFKSKLEEYKAEMGKERQRLMADRKLQRKEERHTKWIKEKEEEAERKRQEEEEALLEAERMRHEEEEAADMMRKQQEQEEYLRKKEALDRQAEKQREREREIDERRRATEQQSQQPQAKSWRSRPTQQPPLSREPEPERSSRAPEPAVPVRRPAETSDWRSARAGNSDNAGEAPPASKSAEPWRANVDRERPRVAAGDRDVPKRTEGVRSWRQAGEAENRGGGGARNAEIPRTGRDERGTDVKGGFRDGGYRDERSDTRGDTRGDSRDTRGDTRGDNRDTRDTRGDSRGDTRGDMRGGVRDREDRGGPKLDWRRGGGGGAAAAAAVKTEPAVEPRVDAAQTKEEDTVTDWSQDNETEKPQNERPAAVSAEEEDGSWQRVSRK